MIHRNRKFRKTLTIATLGALALSDISGFAQPIAGEPHEHPHPPSDNGDPHHRPVMSHAKHAPSNDISMFLLSQSSGTGFQPSAWAMPGRMDQIGSWRLMTMGQVFIVGTQQSGPRGKDQVYATNWGMVAGARNLWSGAILVRTMFSLEPFTVSDRQYPLLFQTGETAFDQPIVDGQHPHDLFMEVGIQYAHPLGKQGIANIYYAPVGDVALGPVAFPHRASAQELPQATLSHHWQDATHIANSVFTIGLSYGKVRWEGSGFHGREPDENRRNIDFGKMDSWSTRLSISPTPNWMGQISVGRLNHPETHHPDDIIRTTASIHHISSQPGTWATSFIWARNDKTVARYATHAITAEMLIPLGRQNYLTGRFEWSQRDELFEYDHELADHIKQTTGRYAFPVAAGTIGYTRDLELIESLQTGIGANLTAYLPDDVLKPFYGSHPWSANLFLRIRLK